MTESSEKELKEGLGCYLVGSVSCEMSSARSWGTYLGRLRDVKGCRRAAAGINSIPLSLPPGKSLVFQ